MTIHKVAVAQAASAAFDRDACLAKVSRLTTEAAQNGAQVVLFPEAFVSGYPKGIDFETQVGMRTPAGRAYFRRYHESAVDAQGPSVTFLSNVAHENRIFLVIGVIEQDGGTLYCTVLFFGPDGAFLGRHRKLVPTAMERVIWGAGDGSTIPVFDSPAGKLGAVICWENYMPLLRTAMYGKGIQIYCAPTMDDRKTWVSSMQHIAIEGRCFVLSCAQFSRRCDFPNDYPSRYYDSPDSIVHGGGSCIVDPFGQLLAGPYYDGEIILYADLDTDQLIHGKYDLDVVGHYARPDIFKLTVDEYPQKTVRFSASSPLVQSHAQGTEVTREGVN